MSKKWVPFKTDLILEKRKKSQEPRSGEYGGVLKLRCTFVRETDEYLGLCEQERPCLGFPKAPPLSRTDLTKRRIQGIVHFELLPHGQTVNQTVYKNILRRLERSVPDGGGAFGKATHGHSITITLLLTVYTALSIGQFFAENKHCSFGTHIPQIWAPVTFSSSPRSNLF